MQRYNKAIVAFIMALIGIANVLGWMPMGAVSEESVTTIVTVLTPLLVYIIPNKAA